MSLDRSKQNANFIINYNIEDEPCIDKVLKILDDNYKRITKKLNKELDEKIEIEIYRDLKELHQALGLNEESSESWIRGGISTHGNIAIASPLNPPPKADFNNVLKTAVHEFVHIIVYKINKKVPKWLNEGIASYEGQDNNYSWIERTLKEGNENNCIPSIKDLDTGDDFALFFKRNGYQYSYSVVEWIVNDYGYEGLINLVKSSGDFERTFNISEIEAEEKWNAFIKSKYI